MTKLPPPKFRRDEDRYIVMCGDDRAGFVRQMDDKRWHATDTFMRKSRNFDTRAKAADWLARELRAAIDHGEI